MAGAVHSTLPFWSLYVTVKASFEAEKLEKPAVISIFAPGVSLCGKRKRKRKGQGRIGDK